MTTLQPTMTTQQPFNIRRALCAVSFAFIAMYSINSSAALTGEYLFEEGAGTTAEDTSGFNRDGTFTGTTGVPGYVGGLYQGSSSALQFNYDSGGAVYNGTFLQRVALPGSTAFVQNAPAMTLMAWVQPDLITGAARSIVGVSETTGGTRGILQFMANGQVRMLGRRVDGGPNANYVTSGASPFAATLGETYFLVGIMDYVNADIRVYINGVQHTGGVLNNTSLGTAGPLNLSADNPNFTAVIGSNTAGTGEAFLGMIDGVRILDHALTDQEILDIYNAEVIPEPSTIALGGLGALLLLYRRRQKS